MEFLKFSSGIRYLGQNRQDAWVLYETQSKRDGYFVDFGATDGMSINNTYMLEKELGWSGIVAEPNPVWHNDLKSNRSCHISLDCVWKKSGEQLEFLATDAPDLSTIKGFGTDDEHARTRTNAQTIKVNTISLTDLLKQYNAPKTIDYLSIDTEGSEYDILYSFLRDDQYRIEHLTVEHNYMSDYRDRLYRLLTANGYQRRLMEVSACDDFYKKVN